MSEIETLKEENTKLKNELEISRLRNENESLRKQLYGMQPVQNVFGSNVNPALWQVYGNPFQNQPGINLWR